MNPRSVAVVTIALMVGLTGCSGTILFEEISSTPGPTTSQPEMTVTDPISYPAGYAESGIIDPEKAAGQFETALPKYDSFTQHTLVKVVNFPNKGSGTTLNTTTKVDIPNRTVYKYIDSTIRDSYTVVDNNVADIISVESEFYYENRTLYVRTQPPLTETTYNITQTSFQIMSPIDPENKSANVTLGPGIATLLGNVNFGEAKQVIRNGETLIRYEASSASNVSSFLVVSLRNSSSVSEFSATLLVDQEGIIRLFEYSVTVTTPEGIQRTITVRYRITDIDSTTVEKPDWLDEAKART